MSRLGSSPGHVLRAGYVATVRAIRAALRATKLLALLDRRAGRSRPWCWVRSLLAIYDFDDLCALDCPWWTFSAAERVSTHLESRPAPRVFEWGSGASTVWLARRAATVFSVEHDAGWALRVAGVAPKNVVLQVRQASSAVTPAVASAKRGFEGLDFGDYVAGIDQHPGDFDLIVIDGRAREACLERAAHRVAADGVIVVDNVERRRYRAAIERHRDRFEVTWTWGMTPCLVYPTRTALLTRRPAAGDC